MSKPKSLFKKVLILSIISMLILSNYLPYIPPLEVKAATITPPNSTVDTNTLLTVSPAPNGIEGWYYDGLTTVRNSGGELGSVRRYISKDKSTKIYMVSGELAAKWARNLTQDGDYVFNKLENEKFYYSFKPPASTKKESFSQYNFLDLLDLLGYTYTISNNVITIQETPLPKVTDFKIKESPNLRSCYPMYSNITIQFTIEEYIPTVDELKNIEVYGMWEGDSEAFHMGNIEYTNTSNGKFTGQFMFTVGKPGYDTLNIYIRAHDGANRIDQDTKNIGEKVGSYSTFGKKITICTATDIKNDGQTIPMYDFTNETLLNTDYLITGLAGRQNGKMLNQDGYTAWFGPVRYPTIYKGYREDGGYRTDNNKTFTAEGRDGPNQNLLAYPLPFLYVIGPIDTSVSKPYTKVHETIPTSTVNVQHKSYFSRTTIKEMFNGYPDYVLSNTPTYDFSTDTGRPLGEFYYIRDLAEYSGGEVSNACMPYNNTCLEIYTTDYPDITEFKLYDKNDYTKVNEPIYFEFNGYEYVSNRQDGSVRNNVKYSIEVIDGPSKKGAKVEGTVKSDKNIKNPNKKMMNRYAGKYTNPSQVKFVPDKEGKYTVQLTITDEVQRLTKSQLIAFKIGPNGGPDEPDSTPNPKPGDDIPKKNNLPPVVDILGPDVVEVGERFCLRADASDPDGYIEYYDWNWYSGEVDNKDTAFTGAEECGLYYEDATEDEVYVQVMDNDGARAEDTHKIKVIYPKPSADFDVNGFLIENRAVWVTPENPYKRNVKIVNKLKIIKNTWKIEAIDQNNQSSIIVIEDDLNNSSIDEVIEVLFRKAGEYRITRYVENKIGYSDTVTKTITIEKDLLPIAEIEVPEKVYLSKDGTETVTIYSNSYSEDDIIGTQIYEIAHDSDNDGSFDDEVYQIISKTAASEINYKVNKLGKYNLRLTAIETFNERTYESHVDLSENLSTTHRKYTQTSTTFEVDNMAPVVSLSAMPQPDIEIVFYTGDVLENNTYTKGKLQSNINSTLLPSLAAENINADIRIQEREWYEDIEGGYFVFNPNKKGEYRHPNKNAIEPIVMYMDFEEGILKETKMTYKGISDDNAARDYEGNIYFNVIPQNTSDCDNCGDGYWFRNNGLWARSGVEIYKYDKEADRVTKFLDKIELLEIMREKEEYRKTRRLRDLWLRDILVGENNNLYLLIGLEIDTSGWDDYRRYLIELSSDGKILNVAKFPIKDDYGLKIYGISNENVYYLSDGDNVKYIPLENLWHTEGVRYNAPSDVSMKTRLFSTEEYEYYYGIEIGDTDYSLRRFSLNKNTKEAKSLELLQADFRDFNFEGIGDDVEPYNYTFYGSNRVGNLFLYLQWRYNGKGNKYSSYLIVDDSNFAMNKQPYKDREMPKELEEYIQKSSMFIFGQDDSFYPIITKGYYSGTPIKKFDEKTNAVLDEYVPIGDKMYGPYCQYNDDKRKCTRGDIYFSKDEIWKYSQYWNLNSNRLTVRAYKKSMADTLKDMEWKSKASTKFFVSLSDKKISNLPKENPEVASLLNQDNIHFISIDTNSTKSIAGQLMQAIEQETLQVTTTYTEPNMKTAMERIAEFIIGVVFPEEDDIIDIHVAVEDSKFTLAQIENAINNILKPRLNNTEYEIKITSSQLVTKNINGQNVRKFNVTKDQDFYILFKDNAMTEINVNHTAADLLLQDAYFIGVGDTPAVNQFDKTIYKNMYRGKIFENPKDLDKTMNDIASYLFDAIRKRVKETDIYALSSENKVLYEANYVDYENNPKFYERHITIHDPMVFENDQGTVEFGTSTLPEIFTKVGLYRPTYQAMDDPLANYSEIDKIRFSDYRKWSNLAGDINIYIHRMPVPEFYVEVNVNTNYYSIKNTAYDLDKESIDIGYGKGIAEQKFQWRLKGQTVWKDGLPPNPLEEKIYEVKNEVMDFQKQRNYIIRELSPFPLPPVAEFEPTPNPVEEGDSVKFINTSYEPTGQDMVAEWYYKESTSNTYKHFATGTYTKGVGNEKWNPSTVFVKEGVYDVKLVVTDEDGLSDETVRQVTVLEKKNKKPKACMEVPSPNYIGDKITIINCSTDEDEDELFLEYVVTKPNGETIKYTTGDSQVTPEGNLIIHADQHPEDLGTWNIVLTVSDGELFDSVEGTMVVLDQIVQGKVAHTEQWLKNIQSYNEEFPSKAFNLDENRGLLEFFKGEKFILSAKETKLATDVAVAIKEYPEFGIVKLKEGSNDIWDGSLWHEDMYFTFKDQEILTFEFVAVFENGWIARDEVKIKIRDDNYWIQHTAY